MPHQHSALRVQGVPKALHVQFCLRLTGLIFSVSCKMFAHLHAHAHRE